MRDTAGAASRGRAQAPSRTLWGRLRGQSAWALAVRAAAPVFKRAWRDVFHPKGRLLYLRSPYAGAPRPVLRRSALEIFSGDPELTATAALVDSALCYHKGGHCRSRERLMLQLNYTVDVTRYTDSIVDSLSLRENPEIQALLRSSRLRRHMVRPNRGFWNSPGGGRRLDHPMFFLARRILTYYVPPYVAGLK